MKTIEESAKEIVFHSIGNLKHFTPEQCFRYGIEFAQRWIAVEEELPEVDCFVLTKSKGNKDEDYFRVLWFRNFEFFTPEITSNITHWRPIEFK